MNLQEQTNYDRIAKAIAYLNQHFREQPSLDEVAASIHVSPFHFQRMFTDWAGVSPKKFLQYISVEYAKGVLQQKETTLMDAAFETGLSGTGRLHDLFVRIEGMTPGEYKNGGASLKINYSIAESPFGEILVASTLRGICHLSFVDKQEESIAGLKAQFPNASYKRITDLIQQNALHIFSHDWSRLDQIKLHIKGSSFQLKVWETLLKIPMGRLSTYSTVSAAIGNPQAGRAVGTAIGRNPVAYLIPCHRVILSGGNFGNYMWGTNRKTAIIGWEAAHSQGN